MQERIDDYRRRLQSQTAPLMPFIAWRPLPDGNLEVTDDTADLYRYFDCTDEAAFLYGCVRRTVEESLPREIDYLERHDRAKAVHSERRSFRRTTTAPAASTP